MTPDTDPDAGSRTYAYDPHLDPQLSWDQQSGRREIEERYAHLRGVVSAADAANAALRNAEKENAPSEQLASLRAEVDQLLEIAKETGDIFYPQSDRAWVLGGADVRVSMIGFDRGEETMRLLNQRTDASADVALATAKRVRNINADLTHGADLGAAEQLRENSNICFQGPVKVGPFELECSVGLSMLQSSNPHGRSNAEVIKPWMNATDVTRRPRGMWIIDFGKMGMEDAALFEAPSESVRKHVKLLRDKNRDRQRRTFWWRLGRSGRDLKAASRHKTRVVVTPRVAKHRLFSWAAASLVPDSRLFAFAVDTDCFFGVLHSRIHELWALGTSSRHGVGNDPTYTTAQAAS